MEVLKDRILKDGKIIDSNILRVDSFLNHQLDISLLSQMADSIYQHYSQKDITKVLTIEASGIPLACFTAQKFNIPCVFAKKHSRKNLPKDVYISQVHSFTHDSLYDIVVNQEYLNQNDRILIIDDFLAHGAALQGLISLIQDSGASLVGVGIAIEKAFQGGGDALREKGLDIYSLARLSSIHPDTGIKFVED